MKFRRVGDKFKPVPEDEIERVAIRPGAAVTAHWQWDTQEMRWRCTFVSNVDGKAYAATRGLGPTRRQALTVAEKSMNQALRRRKANKSKGR